MRFIDPDAHWMRGALCASRDQKIHFADHDFGKQGLNRMEKRAIRMCFDCPVRTECLRYAIDKHERHGIWGGSLDTDRQPVLALLDRHRNDSKDHTEVHEAVLALDTIVSLRARTEGLISERDSA